MLGLLAFKATDVPTTNIIINGDFSQGLNRWYGTGGNILLLQNEVSFLSLTLNGRLQNSVALTTDNIYFIRANIKSTSDKVHLGLSGAQTTFHSGSGKYETLSGTWKSTVTATGQLRVTDPRVSDWDEIFAKNALVINLTEIFGAGSEPTTEQMNTLLKQFPNSWFDGTKNIFNAKHMMNVYHKELTKMRNAITAMGGSV